MAEAGLRLHDVFICHASEDKDTLVRSLAEGLEEHHLDVWYDETSLQLGDSLRQSIDRGLARARYGLVVLSPHFFAKRWPQRELDGLVAREISGGQKVILPVWHNITREEIIEHSPPLADLVAVSSARGLSEIIRHVLRVVRPSGSPLLIARDRLIDLGLSPPVVTDEWWLDVVEASGREPSYGHVLWQDPWGRWTFPLPGGVSARERGERLAFTALQLAWEERARATPITQITHPAIVDDLIRSQPGLAEACAEHPRFVATYAPQLTIRGLGGCLEETFEAFLVSSVRLHEERARFDTRGGTALTTNNQPPLCDEEIALRHETFGNYGPGYLACQFVQGDIGGPTCRAYPTIDYLVWLLSSGSSWMPTTVRNALIEGMRDWATWIWHSHVNVEEENLGLTKYPFKGALCELLVGEHPSVESLPGDCVRDIEGRFSFSLKMLGIEDSLSDVVARFLKGGFISSYLADRRRYSRT